LLNTELELYVGTDEVKLTVELCLNWATYRFAIFEVRVNFIFTLCSFMHNSRYGKVSCSICSIGPTDVLHQG
jgi:hypothetical protein